MTGESVEGGSPTGISKEFSVRQIWLKNASFDAPGVPEMHFNAKGDAALFNDVAFSIRSEVRPFVPDRYELALHVDVRGSTGDLTVFTAAVEEIGLFHVTGYTDAEAEDLLRGKGAEMMYPFAREFILSMLGRCGIQRLDLQPLSTEALVKLMRGDVTPS